MSTKKILSIIALSLSIIGALHGGLMLAIAAFVVSIVSLCSHDGEEKEAKTFAVIALIISLVLIIIYVVYLLAVSRFFIKQYNSLA